MEKQHHIHLQRSFTHRTNYIILWKHHEKLQHHITYSIQFTVLSVLSVLSALSAHSVQCTLHSIHCILSIEWMLIEWSWAIKQYQVKSQEGDKVTKLINLNVVKYHSVTYNWIKRINTTTLYILRKQIQGSFTQN